MPIFALHIKAGLSATCFQMEKESWWVGHVSQAHPTLTLIENADFCMASFAPGLIQPPQIAGEGFEPSTFGLWGQNRRPQQPTQNNKSQ